MTGRRSLQTFTERLSRQTQFIPGHVGGRVASAQPVRRRAAIGEVQRTAPAMVWTALTPPQSQIWYGVTYGDEWGVVGGDYGTVETTPDIVTWTERIPSSSGSDFGTRGGFAIAYAGSLWIAAGGSGKLLTSTDKATWTSRTSNIAGAIYTVAYGDQWIAAGKSGALSTSSDGTTWSAQTSSFGTTDINGLAYNTGGDLWVAVGDGGKIATSANGTAWTQQTSPTANDLYGVAYDGSGRWIAVGAAWTMLTSTNGTTWSALTSPFQDDPTYGDGSVYCVSYGSGRWTAAGHYGQLAGSTDGTTWALDTPAAGCDSRWHSVAYDSASQRWLAVGYDQMAVGALI